MYGPEEPCNMMSEWSEWRTFPDPERGGYLLAPFGPGVYEIRHRSTGELVLFGQGSHVAYRLTSLFPQPWGRGTRNNNAKRTYMWDNRDDLEYRTLACTSKDEAKAIERTLPKTNYRFKT